MKEIIDKFNLTDIVHFIFIIAIVLLLLLLLSQVLVAGPISRAKTPVIRL